MAREINKLKAVKLHKLTIAGRHSDGNGLYLQVIKSGSGYSRTWLFQYVSPLTGKVRQKGLGPLTTVGLSEARGIAGDMCRLVKKRIDPIATEREKTRKDRAASDAKVTFEKVARDYVAAHRSSWRNKIHASQWLTSLERYAFDKIGKLDISEVTKRHVIAILEPHWDDKTETMSRVQGRISNVFDAAVARDYRTDNPAHWTVLKHLLPSPRTLKRLRAKHHAAMLVDEVPAFMTKLRGNESMSARALEFTVLTVARTNETIGATWKEIDLDAKMWTIPGTRMKAGREHRVPLSDRAVQILRRLPRVNGNNYVFVGPSANGGLSRMAMYALVQGMRKGVTTHGFRSSFRDWAEERTAFPASVIEMALAHVQQDKTVAAYLRSQLWEKRKKLAAEWSKFCATSVAAKGDNVVPLQSRERAR